MNAWGPISEAGRECRSCHVFKPWDAFYVNHKGRNGRMSVCISCRRSKRAAEHRENHAYLVAQRRARLLRDPDCGLRKRLKKLSVARETYDSAYARGCEICNSAFRGRKHAHLDHNHATGEFRGLLCPHCNAGLGWFQEDEARLARAIVYLKTHGSKRHLSAGVNNAG